MKLYEAYCRMIRGGDRILLLGGNPLSGKSSLTLILKGLGQGAILSCGELTEENGELSRLLEGKRVLLVEDGSMDGSAAEELLSVLSALARRLTVVIIGEELLKREPPSQSERLELDPVEYEECSVYSAQKTSAGQIRVRKNSALLSVVRDGRGVEVEDLELFCGELIRGDIYFAGGKEEQARAHYSRALERAVKEGLRDQEAACAFRLAACRFFTEERVARELSEAAARAEEPVLRSRLQSLAEAILGGRTDRAEYSCLLMEDRV